MSNLAYNIHTDVNEKVWIMSEQIVWITTAEAAKIIKSTVSNVTYLCRTGEIKCEKFGRAWKVSKQDAIDYVRSGRAGRKSDN